MIDKKDYPSLEIIDAKSINNVDTAEEKSYNGRKKFLEEIWLAGEVSLSLKKL